MSAPYRGGGARQPKLSFPTGVSGYLSVSVLLPSAFCPYLLSPISYLLSPFPTRSARPFRLLPSAFLHVPIHRHLRRHFRSRAPPDTSCSARDAVEHYSGSRAADLRARRQSPRTSSRPFAQRGPGESAPGKCCTRRSRARNPVSPSTGSELEPPRPVVHHRHDPRPALAACPRTANSVLPHRRGQSCPNSHTWHRIDELPAAGDNSSSSGAGKAGSRKPEVRKPEAVGGGARFSHFGTPGGRVRRRKSDCGLRRGGRSGILCPRAVAAVIDVRTASTARRTSFAPEEGPRPIDRRTA